MSFRRQSSQLTCVLRFSKRSLTRTTQLQRFAQTGFRMLFRNIVHGSLNAMQRNRQLGAHRSTGTRKPYLYSEQEESSSGRVPTTAKCPRHARFDVLHARPKNLRLKTARPEIQQIQLLESKLQNAFLGACKTHVCRRLGQRTAQSFLRAVGTSRNHCDVKSSQTLFTTESIQILLRPSGNAFWAPAKCTSAGAQTDTLSQNKYCLPGLAKRTSPPRPKEFSSQTMFPNRTDPANACCGPSFT